MGKKHWWCLVWDGKKWGLAVIGIIITRAIFKGVKVSFKKILGVFMN